MEILSIVTNISIYGGAEKVMLDLHRGLGRQFSTKILCLQPLKGVHPKYGLSPSELLRLRNPWQLNNKILLVHSRNLIPFFVLLKKLFFLNVRIIYISHNVYSTFKNFTYFPKEVVSISHKVTANLQNYFRLKPAGITLIPNGMEDLGTDRLNYTYQTNGKIRILYPARVNGVKRQLALVAALQEQALAKNIEIHFAGIGEDYEALKRSCDYEQFKPLGFVENMPELIQQYDYLMLFSVQEGLPLSLIEGAMHGKPLLVNDVGGNLEIGLPNENALLLVDDLSSIGAQLNALNEISEAAYQRMAKRSRAIYKEKFGYERMITQYTDLILQNRVSDL